MITIILAGGQGTRIGDATQTIPKPMLKVGTFPLIHHVMKIYATQGYRDFIICLGYLGDKIRNYFDNYYLYNSYTKYEFGYHEPIKSYHDCERINWTLGLLETGLKTETGGRLYKTIPHLSNTDPVMVTYADGLANINLNELVEFHKKQGKLGTITAVLPPARFGEVKINNGLVDNFVEKPQVSSGSHINGGFAIFEREAFNLLDPTTSMERGLLEPLSQRGELAVYEHKGWWQCCDTARELEMLNELWEANQAPWKVWK